MEKIYTSTRQLFDCLPSSDTMQLAHADEVLAASGLPRLTELLDARFNQDEREKAEEERTKNAREQADAQASSISEMVAALTCDYERLAELREAKRPWLAGWNMPGYMPDSEPAEFETFNEARDYIGDTLERAGNECDNDEGENREKSQALFDMVKAFRISEEQEISQQAADGFVYWITKADRDGLSPEDWEELQELETAAGECADEDEARQRIEEDALSVEMRGGWYSVGGESEPEEFKILLCTGGPAVQIRGELDEHNEPSRAWIEYQDWFTPWMEYHGDAVSHDDLLKYCRVFYFGG